MVDEISLDLDNEQSFLEDNTSELNSGIIFYVKSMKFRAFGKRYKIILKSV